MVQPELVDRKLTLLASYAGYLEQLAQVPRDEFLARFQDCGAARYYLQASLECCFDIGAHIIATDTSKRAEDYRSILRVLGEEGVLPADIVTAMQPSAALRNRLVHAYDQVDDVIVHDMLASAAGTFRAFAAAIAAYLDRGVAGPG